ncbi:carboxypeptidase-like regulatory domain-containing protein [Flavobacterium sp. 3HN19-14]|uniref:carboxypeptidase-like regulatory domain-containing protein n=1 Tax=Flavobacterium sp. 3HN19-14 TaxID=3448133 RepID=UPI003EE325C2
MRFKFKWIFTLLLALVLQSSFAQKTITGIVTDEKGDPLPSATITVKETKVATAAGIDGKYSIQASTGQTLEFSLVGMATFSQKVGASNVINAKLKDDATILADVVVVGYGKTTKEAYVGTAAKISTANVQAKTFSNVTNALKGEVAGVNVIQTSGQPGY